MAAPGASPDPRDDLWAPRDALPEPHVGAGVPYTPVMDDYSSALAAVRELKDLGAVRVRVGDIEVVFGPETEEIDGSLLEWEPRALDAAVADADPESVLYHSSRS